MSQQPGGTEEATTAARVEEPVGAAQATPIADVVAIVAVVVSGLAAASLVWGKGRGLLKPRPRPTPPWAGHDVAAVILLHLACQVVAAELLLPRPLVEGTVVWQQLAASILASLTTLAIAIPWLAVRGQGWLPLRLASGKPVADIAVGLLMLLAVTPALLIVAGLLNQIVPYHHPILDFLAADRGPRALLLTATSAVLVAPLAEEFFFRGVLQGWLERVAPAAAVQVSAAAFGLAHVDHGLGWIPLVGFGVAAGFLTRQTGSLLASITLHAGFNAVGLATAMAQLPAG